MNKILLFGAGRSATDLIDYLLIKAKQLDWSITVVDSNLEQAKMKIGDSPVAKAVGVDIFNDIERQALIRSHDLVISMLPASLHMLVATDCYEIGRHVCTASYITDEMAVLAEKAQRKGLIFMGELGLDPGLDHMSAMECIDDIKSRGGELLSFKSFTGGLVAPESDTNPWHYKISWNPRNIVLAGQSTATYLYKKRLKYIPYRQLYRRYILTEILGMGEYEMYVNRDSLSYRHIYGIDDIPTIIRGTLRHKGYCDAWDAVITLGLTDDSFKIEQSSSLTYAELIEAYIPAGQGDLKSRVATYLGCRLDSDIMHKLEFLGLFSDEKIRIEMASPAQILEEIVTSKWKLLPEDKDMIIMQHEFQYNLDGKQHELKSTLVMEGRDAVRTAMSKTVGLPLAVFVCLVMTGEITKNSATRPVTAEIYKPILVELKNQGIDFKHAHQMIGR
jgi:saccharopine dehydrogenase (NADP+, L-glutamate forming)